MLRPAQLLTPGMNRDNSATREKLTGSKLQRTASAYYGKDDLLFKRPKVDGTGPPHSKGATSSASHPSFSRTRSALSISEPFATPESRTIYHTAQQTFTSLGSNRFNHHPPKDANTQTRPLKRKGTDSTSSSRSNLSQCSSHSIRPRCLRAKAHPLPSVKDMMNTDISSSLSRADATSKSDAPAQMSPNHSAPKGFANREFTKADFSIGRPLGRGRFGTVYMAKEIQTGFICAIKYLPKKEIVRSHLERTTQREINLNGLLQNPNILHVYGSFSDEKYIYLIVEYAAQGELFSKLKGEGRFAEDAAAKYIYQVINALLHLHQNSVLHRDLKPENILVAHDGRLLLSDFGWAVQARKPRRSLVGTPDYISPELVEGQAYDQTSDVWALGVLTYEFLVGYTPFEVHNDDKEYRATYARIAKVDLKFPNHVSPLAADFITRILKRNPHERMSLVEALNHEWITSY
ncbi:spindle assembly checkpoint kinase, partial [Massospora cicadina]